MAIKMLLNFDSHFKINENRAYFNNPEKASNTYCILILRQTDRRHILIFDFRFNYFCKKFIGQCFSQ